MGKEENGNGKCGRNEREGRREGTRKGCGWINPHCQILHILLYYCTITQPKKGDKI